MKKKYKNKYVIISIIVLLIFIASYIIYKDSIIYYYDEPNTPSCGINNMCKDDLVCAKPTSKDMPPKCISLKEQLKKTNTCWDIWTGKWSTVCPDGG